MPVFSVHTDPAKMDWDWVCDVLAESYWAQHLPRTVIRQALDEALCFGAFLDQTQIGFARVVTDYHRFGYLSDVFIDPAHRGQGFGVQLLDHIFAHPRLQDVRRWMLHTADAHGLYAKFGFTAPANPDWILTRKNP